MKSTVIGLLELINYPVFILLGYSVFIDHVLLVIVVMATPELSDDLVSKGKTSSAAWLASRQGQMASLLTRQQLYVGYVESLSLLKEAIHRTFFHI